MTGLNDLRCSDLFSLAVEEARRRKINSPNELDDGLVSLVLATSHREVFNKELLRVLGWSRTRLENALRRLSFKDGSPLSSWHVPPREPHHRFRLVYLHTNSRERWRRRRLVLGAGDVEIPVELLKRELETGLERSKNQLSTAECVKRLIEESPRLRVDVRDRAELAEFLMARFGRNVSELTIRDAVDTLCRSGEIHRFQHRGERTFSLALDERQLEGPPIFDHCGTDKVSSLPEWYREQLAAKLDAHLASTKQRRLFDIVLLALLESQVGTQRVTSDELARRVGVTPKHIRTWRRTLILDGLLTVKGPRGGAMKHHCGPLNGVVSEESLNARLADYEQALRQGQSDARRRLRTTTTACSVGHSVQKPPVSKSRTLRAEDDFRALRGCIAEAGLENGQAVLRPVGLRYTSGLLGAFLRAKGRLTKYGFIEHVGDRSSEEYWVVRIPDGSIPLLPEPPAKQKTGTVRDLFGTTAIPPAFPRVDEPEIERLLLAAKARILPRRRRKSPNQGSAP